MIVSLFHREDVEAICKIPLSRRAISNSIIWMYNKNGKFSIKSAYKLARSIQGNGNRAESSRGCAGKIIWPVVETLYAK